MTVSLVPLTPSKRSGVGELQVPLRYLFEVDLSTLASGVSTRFQRDAVNSSQLAVDGGLRVASRHGRVDYDDIPCVVAGVEEATCSSSLWGFRMADSETQTADKKTPLVLLTGATGYVGRRMISLLERSGNRLRCLARNPDKLRPSVVQSTEIMKGNVLDRPSLDAALCGVEVAYYLVHLMNSADFERQDRIAAKHFAAAAKAAKVQRIIYLGGLGEESDPKLSAHLRSRHEVGRILCDSGVETVEFRAAVVIGAGSLSFELIRSLADRLPVMICPRWLATPTQPIAVDDVLAYLLKAIDLPRGDSRIFEIGSAEVATYGGLIQEYARQRGLRRWLVSVPVLTPYLSSLWLGLVTPSNAQVGRHLIEGLRNPTIVRDKSALEQFSVKPMNITRAMKRALEVSREESVSRARLEMS